MERDFTDVILHLSKKGLKTEIVVFNDTTVEAFYLQILERYKQERGETIKIDRLALVNIDGTLIYNKKQSQEAIWKRLGDTDECKNFILFKLCFPRYRSRKARVNKLGPSLKTLEKAKRHDRQVALPFDARGFNYRVTLSLETRLGSIVKKIAKKLHKNPKDIGILVEAALRVPLFHGNMPFSKAHTGTVRNMIAMDEDSSDLQILRALVRIYFIILERL